MALQIKGINRKDLLKEYKKLAKRADQRLVRIEGYRHQKNMKGIESYAYKSAMKDIRRFSGEGAKRFNTKAPESDTELLKKIASIKKFLESPTSTKQGILKLYKKRADELNKNSKIWGDDKEGNLTWQDYARIFNVIDTDNKDSRFNYLEVIRSADIVKEYNLNKKDIDKSLDKLVITGNVDIVEKEMISSLYKSGLTLDKLIR